MGSSADVTGAHRFSGQYFLRLARFTGATLILATVFLLGALIQMHVNAFVAPRRSLPTHTPADLDLVYRDVTLTTADGLELAAWYIPGSQPNAIIVVHGINANRAALLPEARVLAGAGYHLLIIDLRGHGHSQGTEVTYGYREALDIQAAIDYLLALPGVEQVGALGNSYGGAAVVRAAAVDKRLEAIVIQSSYSSLPEAVEDAFDDMAVLPKWPFAPLIIALVEKRVGLEISQVDSARDLATIHPRPVLIVHGAEDDLFPVRHAHKMYNAARRPKDLWIVEDLGHASPVKLYEAAYKERVLTFFANAFAKRNQ